MAVLAVSITPLPLVVGAAARELRAASGETGPISVSVPAPAVRAATLRAPAAPMAVMPLVVRPVAVVVVAALKAHSFRPRRTERQACDRWQSNAVGQYGRGVGRIGHLHAGNPVHAVDRGRRRLRHLRRAPNLIEH